MVRCRGRLSRAALDRKASTGGCTRHRTCAGWSRASTPACSTTRPGLLYENGFKGADSSPHAPNVLVATPTLEMGIDIGDLSAVFLASLPRTVASYLQRVGRAGRLTGNALDLAYVTGRGEHLPKLGDPLSVINGEVRPPATYLQAEEILRRQFTAHLVDEFARDQGGSQPTTATAAIGSSEPDSFLGEPDQSSGKQHPRCRRIPRRLRITRRTRHGRSTGLGGSTQWSRHQPIRSPPARSKPALAINGTDAQTPARRH